MTDDAESIERCRQILRETSRTDPLLFHRIRDELVRNGTMVNDLATARARKESPNVAIVFDVQEGGERYIELVGRDFVSWPYDGATGKNLVTEQEARDCYESSLSAADVEDLRFIEKDHVRYYDLDDICDRFLSRVDGCS